MEEQIKVLLCEDDENLGTLLREYLQAKGCDTDLQDNGLDGLNAFKKNKYDICILDVMMPVMDGMQLAKEIREINHLMPIIFLTAKTQKSDVQEGFRAGCDDYMTKPFSMEELVLRINAVMRRVNGNRSKDNSPKKLGSFTFDSQKQLLYPENQDPIKLTTKESELLALLYENKNKILERSYALKSIWQEETYFNARSMDVYITKLRKHLHEDPQVEIINIHGKGYKLITPETEKDQEENK